MILCSHPPVITCGTSTERDHIKLPEIASIKVERGGSVTYHGPEQLIAYPILNLHNFKSDVGWYMRSLEEVVIQTLHSFNLKAMRIIGCTGVWTAPRQKIAFIGVKLSRWCSFHGLSINLYRCRDRFSAILPCGFSDIEITSLEEQTGSYTERRLIEAAFVDAFLKVFGLPSYR